MTSGFRRGLAACVLASASLVAASGARAEEPRPALPSLPAAPATPRAGDLPEPPPPEPAPVAVDPASAGGFSYGVAPPDPSTEPRTRRRSTGMMVAGIVLGGLGAVSAIYGGAVLASDGNQCLPFADAKDCEATDPETAGAVMMIAGGALIATGIPLLILGSREVEVEPSPRPAPAAWLAVGPTSATLRVQF
jgi:hypothetical protein